MVPEALEARLKVLEDEIWRLSKLAAESSDQLEQDKYWNLACDIQREARALRAYAQSISETPQDASPPPTRRTHPCDLHHIRFGVR